jgi:hypothetical protein
VTSDDRTQAPPAALEFAERRRDIEPTRPELPSNTADLNGRSKDKQRGLRTRVNEMAHPARAQAATKGTRQDAGKLARQIQRAVRHKVVGGMRAPAADKRALLKLLYKPLGFLVSALAGVLASALFNKASAKMSGDKHVPEASSARNSTPKILLTAALQGAVFAAAKAAADRASAKGYRKLTGVDPGK